MKYATKTSSGLIYWFQQLNWIALFLTAFQAMSGASPNCNKFLYQYWLEMLVRCGLRMLRSLNAAAGLWVMNVLEQMFSYVGREDIPVFDSASAIIWQINPPNERPVAMAWKNTHLIGWYVRVFVCLPSTCWLLVTPQIFNVALNLHLLLISYLIHRVVTLNYGWELYIFKVSQNSLYCYTVGYYVDRKLILM